MRVVPLFSSTAVAANATATSAMVSLVSPHHNVTDAVGNDGFCSIQYAVTGAITFHFDFSHDGATWVEGSTIDADSSGLKSVTVVFAPYMRVRAVETAAAAATVTASVCV